MTESAVNVLQILSLQVQHQSHCFQMLSTTSNLILLNMLKQEILWYQRQGLKNKDNTTNNGGSEFDDIKDKGRETITTSSQREGPLEKPISQIVIGATFWINWSLKYKYKYK